MGVARLVCGLASRVWGKSPVLCLLLLLVGDLAAGPLRWRYPFTENRLPDISILAKQVSNFVPGQRATISLVYHSSEPLLVRWFRLVPRRNLPTAELENMLPIKGDANYEVKQLSSGKVVATMLSIPFVENIQAKFTVVLTATSANLQYQVNILLDEMTRHELTYLDSIHWMAAPSKDDAFLYQQNLKLNCTALLDRESNRGFADELKLFRMVMKRHHKKRTDALESELLGHIHKNRQNYNEGDMTRYKVKGLRKDLIGDYYSFHVGVQVVNATIEEQGMYVCDMEREHDRTYLSTWVRQGQRSVRPTIQLMSCQGKILNRGGDFISMQRGVENCFRCRGFAHPQPKVILRKNGTLVQDGDFFTVDSHINVPDGGLVEETYVLRNPQDTHEGKYECIVSNGVEPDNNIKFWLSVD